MRKLIGDRAFYRRVVSIVVPIVIQNTVTNVVNLLDNFMVGQVGTEAISGVAISNQLIFIFNLCIFGGLSGAGIFGAQFFGQGNNEGVRNTFRFKLITAAVVLTAALTVFITFGPNLISSYLTDGEGAGNLATTFTFGTDYMRIMLIGFIPFSLTQCYSGTLRETGETKLPMRASIVAVLTNFCLNYIFIFGKLGLPAMGSNGAALATVISRFVELAIVVTVTHRHKISYPFIDGAYRTLRVPASLAKAIVIKGAPLLANEGIWASGMAMISQNNSLRGLAVIAALNIAGTLSNIFNVVFISMGNAIGIMVGQELGNGEIEKAKDTDRKLIAFNISICFALGIILFMSAPLVPRFYQTTDTVRALATTFIRVSACFMPMYACGHSCYFTLRSGGRTMMTFIFDSGFMWAVNIPLSFILVRLTSLPIVPIYIACQSADLLKCAIGLILVGRGVWARNIVGGRDMKALPAE